MAKIDNDTLNYRVYRQVIELIGSGMFQPGSRLDERALADEMGVSRTPIREAIGKLVKEGLVEHRPYRGNFVRTFTVAQVNDLYEVRKSLEGLVVRLAVPKITEDDVETLRQILDDISAALANGDMGAFAGADQRFHRTLAALAGNQTLIDILDRLSLQIQLIRVTANRDPTIVERTTRERPLILAALQARDAERAATLMEEHIEGVRRAAAAQFETLQLEEADVKGGTALVSG